MANQIKSIRLLQQQPTDELDQFLMQCQVSETLMNKRVCACVNNVPLFLQSKDRELAQYRHELQRVRQTITEVISFISSFIQGEFFFN